MKTEIKTQSPIPYVPKSEQKPSKKLFKTLTKLSIILLLIASLGANYALLKRFYVVRCAEGGMFMEKSTCDKFAQKNVEIAEEHRQEMIANNLDLFSTDN